MNLEIIYTINLFQTSIIWHMNPVHICTKDERIMVVEQEIDGKKRKEKPMKTNE